MNELLLLDRDDVEDYLIKSRSFEKEHAVVMAECLSDVLLHRQDFEQIIKPFFDESGWILACTVIESKFNLNATNGF